MSDCCQHHTRRQFMAGIVSLVAAGAVGAQPDLGLVGVAEAAEALKVGGLPVT
jgi:hypothetical protein